jgi:hypothetical protein
MPRGAHITYRRRSTAYASHLHDSRELQSIGTDMGKNTLQMVVSIRPVRSSLAKCRADALRRDFQICHLALLSSKRKRRRRTWSRVKQVPASIQSLFGSDIFEMPTL